MHQPVMSDGKASSNRLDKVNFLEGVRHSPFSRITLITIKILIGIGLLVFSIQGIDWEGLISGIRSADLTWLAMAVLLVLTGLVLKIWRWAVFLKYYQIQTGGARLFKAFFVGQAVNIVMPLRGGELVRIGYFGNDIKIIPQVVATIALEKYLDLLGLAVCGIIVSISTSIDHLVKLRSWLLPLASVLTLLLLAAILFGPRIWGTIRRVRWLPKQLVDWVDGFVTSSQWLRNPRRVFPGILLTALIWCVMWSTNLLLFKSLGLIVSIPAAGIVLITVYVALFPALMPGNIGPFYLFARLALAPFGIYNDPALAYAVILHAIVTLPPLIAGAVGFLIYTKGKAVT